MYLLYPYTEHPLLTIFSHPEVVPDAVLNVVNDIAAQPVNAILEQELIGKRDFSAYIQTSFSSVSYSPSIHHSVVHNSEVHLSSMRLLNNVLWLTRFVGRYICPLHVCSSPCQVPN